MKDGKMKVFTPDPNMPQPDEPLKPSTSFAVLTKYIGAENAKLVKEGEALVENPWTGRTYESDTVYYLSIDWYERQK